MNKNSLLYILLVLLFSGCQSQQLKSQHANPILGQLQTLSKEEQSRYFEALLQADKAIKSYRYDLASSYYLEAAQLSKSSLLAQRAIFMAEKTEDALTSYQIALSWVKFAPENQLAYAWKAIGEFRSHQKKLAQKTLNQLLTITKESKNHDFIGISEQILKMTSAETSLAYFQTLSQQHPENPEIFMVIARIHEHQNQISQAIKQAENAIKLAPQNSFYIEQKGLLYQQSGQTEKALEFFKAMHEKHPKAYSLNLQLAKLLYQQGNNVKAEHLLKDVVENKPEDLYAHYLYAVTLLANKKIEASETVFEYLLSKKYNLNSTNYFLGSINQNLKLPNQALKYFAGVKNGKYLYQARINSAQILYAQKNLKAALQQLRSVPSQNTGEQMALASNEIALLKDSGQLTSHLATIWKEFRENPTNAFLFSRAMLSAKSSAERGGMIQLAFNNTRSYDVTKRLVEIAATISSRMGDSNQSLELLDGFLNRFPGDVSLRYVRAMQYAALNKTNKMEDDLKYILREKPDHIDALNALGYSMADNNRDLNKAYQMILTAFRSRPGNAAITDSLGWVLYRQGKLKEATIHLQQAWNLNPSADIGAHLGEVLWVSGQKEKAQEYWQKALQLDAKNKLLEDTLKKFTHD